MCNVCAAIGGYCGQCDGRYWDAFNAEAEQRRQAAVKRITKRKRKERALTLARQQAKYLWIRWAGFSCSLLPKQQPVYQDRCQRCGGHGCAACAYWESTR